jgi:hypothetical protein
MILYNDTGQTEKAAESAECLLKKPVKIPSQTIDKMKSMAEQILYNSLVELDL